MTNFESSPSFTPPSASRDQSAPEPARDALPPLLRGVGTTLILIAAVIAFVVARNDVQKQRAAREAVETRRKVEVDLRSLASEISELRQEVEHQDVVEEVLENRWFELLGLVGAGVVASSFYAEWHIRRSKGPRPGDAQTESSAQS